MKKYICKYCNKTVVNDYGFDSHDNLVTLIDHLILCHRDRLEELGGIYLNDIPKRCYILEVNACGGSKAEDKKE